ncbi:hypothetical protein ACP3P8_23100 [Pseudomonas aeruginosa]
MNKAPASDAKENLIKARFDDEVYEQILAQCRRLKLRRAVLVRQIVQAWLEASRLACGHRLRQFGKPLEGPKEALMGMTTPRPPVDEREELVREAINGMPEDQLLRLQEYAHRQGVTVEEAVVLAVRQQLARQAGG